MRLALPLALTLALMPFAAFAVGSDDTEPPKPTETTTKCKDGTIWDEKTKTCVEPETQGLNDDTRFKAVRELAYAGRYDDALAVLATMQEGDSDRVLTYKGFANRKAGRVAEGLAYYDQALAVNPDNFLTRSYLGQAMVEAGKVDIARQQLAEIRARGGAGTWAEHALAEAIETGRVENY